MQYIKVNIVKNYIEKSKIPNNNITIIESPEIEKVLINSNTNNAVYFSDNILIKIIKKKFFF